MAGELSATFECSLEGATFAACASPVTYSNLAPGNHSLKVRAKDAADNMDATPASYSWTVSRPNNPGDGGRCRGARSRPQ